MNPVSGVVILLDEANVAPEINLVDRQLDSLDVAPPKMKLNLRVGEKNIRYAYRDGRPGDVVDLILSLIVVASLALPMFVHQPAKQLDCLDVVRLLLPLAVAEVSDTPGARHPFAEVIERVIVPISGFTGLDRGFKLFRHALASFPIAALSAKRHRDKIVQMRSIVLGQRIFNYCPVLREGR